jgi:5'-3' exonuclease
VLLHLVDGTYELFRQYYGAPASTAPDGTEVGATRGLLRTLLSLLREEGTTHVAVAFDHVIESFRNELLDGYKRGDEIDPELLAQFPLGERATRALGITCWPMVEFEADDALATGVERWVDAPGVEQVRICSPDKDLAQCVRGQRVVLLDRRRRVLTDEAGVIEKYGVRPASIPHWLALVGDAADGIPGIPRWGAKSAAQVLAHYGRIDAIPDDPATWEIKVRGAKGLAESLASRRDEARLYLELTTLRVDVPLAESLDDLRWRGASRKELEHLCEELGEEQLLERVPRWAHRQG